MIQVRLFAAAAAAASADALEIDNVSTIADLQARIAELGNERLSHVLSISSFLVNGKRAEVSDAVPADAQVDVLPPFAGG